MEELKADDERCAPIKTSTAERLKRTLELYGAGKQAVVKYHYNNAFHRKLQRKSIVKADYLGKGEIVTHFQLKIGLKVFPLI